MIRIPRIRIRHTGSESDTRVSNVTGMSLKKSGFAKIFDRQFKEGNTFFRKLVLPVECTLHFLVLVSLSIKSYTFSPVAELTPPFVVQDLQSIDDSIFCKLTTTVPVIFTSQEIFVWHP